MIRTTTNLFPVNEKKNDLIQKIQNDRVPNNKIIMCWWMSLMRKDTLSITVLRFPPTKNKSYLVNNKAVSCGNSCVCFKRQNSSNILDAETPAKEN